jgi:hypothetical protein
MKALPSVIICILLSVGVHAGEDPYGRLFTTPDQRARLDNRFGHQSADNDSASGMGESGAHQSTRPLMLNGTLTSSIGKKEVWINGESQLAPGLTNSNRVRLVNAGSVRIKPASSGQEHDMKPGQLLDPNTGKVIEAYEQASAVYKPPQETDSGNAPDTIQ